MQTANSMNKSIKKNAETYAVRPYRRKQKKHSRIWFLLCCLFISAALIYLIISLNYLNAFFPNTVISEISVSGMTLNQVESIIDTKISDYELILTERNGLEERIYGKDIDLHAVYDGSLEEILENQKPLLWGIHSMKGKEYQQDLMITYDKEKLSSAINDLNCLDPAQITKPTNAYLSYTKDKGLQIISQKLGNEPIPERLTEEILNAIVSLKEEISFDELDIYKKPEVSSDSAVLMAQQKAFENYSAITVTYHFGRQTEVLSGETICQWLTDDGNGNISVDSSQLSGYVKNLAQKYNTAYCAKELKTTYGSSVTIVKGYYGWMIDQEAETAALTDIILSGESQEREPVYKQTAASHDGPDYGNTYVEMYNGLRISDKISHSLSLGHQH